MTNMTKRHVRRGLAAAIVLALLAPGEGVARPVGAGGSVGSQTVATGVAPRRTPTAAGVAVRFAQDAAPAVPELDEASQVAEARLGDVWTLLRARTRSFLLLLPVLAVAFAVVVAFGILAWAVGRWLPAFRVLGGRENPFLVSMVRRVIQFTLVIIGLVVALELLDATALVGAVVGTAGLAGLALGFAFKDIVENYLAGILLSVRQPFAKNDLVDIAGHLGKVVRLTGRETILMTPDGNHVQIPNATVFREPMLNYTRNPRRRVRIDVGIASDEEPSAALDVGCRVLRDMDGVLSEPKPDGLISGYGNGTTELRFFGWVDQRQAEFGRVQSEAFRLIKRALDEAGIATPSPEYRVSLSGTVPRETPGVRPPPRPEPATAPPIGGEAAGEQRDVSVDRALDEQIEEERRKTDQENLLQ
jgi:small-conductance mechanosensitive channel